MDNPKINHQPTPPQSPRLKDPFGGLCLDDEPESPQKNELESPQRSEPVQPLSRSTKKNPKVVEPSKQLKLCEQTLKIFLESKPGLTKPKSFFLASNLGENVIKKGADMVTKLLKQGCPPEMAQQFAVLVLYDLVLLVDDSSSMATEDGGKRISTLLKVLEAVAGVYELAREGGIMSVRYLNGRQGRKDVTTAKVDEVHASIRYNGVTRIGTELQEKIIKPFVQNKKMEKPLLTMVITDGDVEGEKKDLLERNIHKCLVGLQKHPEKTSDAVAFMFARIGDDPDAKELIDKLDDHKEMNQWIDCLPVDSHLEDIGTGSPSHWRVLRKLLLGALSEDIDNDDAGWGDTDDEDLEELKTKERTPLCEDR